MQFYANTLRSSHSTELPQPTVLAVYDDLDRLIGKTQEGRLFREDEKHHAGSFRTILPGPGRYSFAIATVSWELHATLSWGQKADWDFHLLTPTEEIWWFQLEADGFSLLYDAYPGCEEEQQTRKPLTGKAATEHTGFSVNSSRRSADLHQRRSPPRSRSLRTR